MSSARHPPLREFSPVRAWWLVVLLISLVALPWWVDGLSEEDRTTIQRLTDVQFQVNINQASAEELQAIPSIGPRMAERIVTSRRTEGLFVQLEDLQRIPGIGENLFLRIKPYLTIEGQTKGQGDTAVAIVTCEE